MENYMRYRFMGGKKKLKKGVLPRFNLPKSKKQNLTERRGIIKIELDIPEANILNQMDGTVRIKSEPDVSDIETVLLQSSILNEMDRPVIIKTEPGLPGSDTVLSKPSILDRIDESVFIKSDPDSSEANILNQACFILKTEPDLSPPELISLETTETRMDDSILMKMEPDATEVHELQLPEMNMLCQAETNSDVREEITEYLYSPNQQIVRINQRDESSGPDHPYDSNKQSSKNQANKSMGLKFPYILDQEVNAMDSIGPPTEDKLLHGINHDFKHMFTSSSDDTETWVMNRCIQTNLRPKVRSRGITCKAETRNAATSPIRRYVKKRKIITDENWISEASDSEVEDVRIEILKDRMFETRTKAFIENDPLLFLGVPKMALHVIKNFQKRSRIPILHIYCVLKKIRLNLSNEVLSYDFGLSYCQISQIFKRTVPLIAKYLKKYIFWPEGYLISENLPLQFRNRLKKVQSILYIFEIKMERSTLVQGLRLPSYESTETAKFLVSSTPHGFINFVSTRYCKGNLDVTIVKNSGFLEILPQDVAVLTLADRGFKYVDNILRKKNCRLIRLPSISMKKNWKTETKISRWLASVRIHVKRLMNQLRDYKILENSVNLGNRSESLLDDILIIAAALSNIQLTAS